MNNHPSDDVDPRDSDDPIVLDARPAETDAAEDQDDDNEVIAYAEQFMKNLLRLRVVRIDRDDYLKHELRKLALPQTTIDRAIATTPVQAGIRIEMLDALADKSIAYETNKSTAASFMAGIPGGFVMLASVPGDLMQYYVHAFRIMQKLAYLYGWKELLSDMEDVDDETLGKLATFLGVMMGVSGAQQSLSALAQAARPALQKQIANQALTKTAWYGPMKQVLKMVGIKVTKDSFAKTVTKVVPVVGGVFSGAMTFASLRSQSSRLQKHLREIPPPGVDAEKYFQALHAADEVEAAEDAEKFTSKVIDGASDGAKELADGAKDLAEGAKDAAKDAAEAGAAQAKKWAGKLFNRKKDRDEDDDPTPGDDGNTDFLS